MRNSFWQRIDRTEARAFRQAINGQRTWRSYSLVLTTIRVLLKDR
ncbi:hypothetical protein Deipe_0493 [Deinococcus peraridilitoris DSM 19664]|uniref:Uncharacterized protein n=1 Tax=Deinococcus peraridilitoris (strain DSM 19664 / LMG 22246 / CIP 109416 / KR-200) TaxID=937777 RepID=K9ZY28_DEIPD|nr:hypothetical protein Deipe_0493 [Deinococcus peraridilitoris DSM 19664]